MTLTPKIVGEELYALDFGAMATPLGFTLGPSERGQAARLQRGSGIAGAGIVERLGMYDASKLQPHYALVFDDLDEMLEAHAKHPFNRPVAKRNQKRRTKQRQ